MLNRALRERELELLHMINDEGPSTWRDMVDEVRRYMENNRFNARRMLKNLRNGNSEVGQGHEHDMVPKAELLEGCGCECN